MGVDLDQPVVLTTPFRLAEPLWSRDELYEMGLDGNPNLHALRENHRASDYRLAVSLDSSVSKLIQHNLGFNHFNHIGDFFRIPFHEIGFDQIVI